MSRDIFVQDIPADAHGVEDIPDDWMPSPLPFAASHVVAAVQQLAPTADFSDPSLAQVTLPGADIEVSLGGDEPLVSFALHIRGEGQDVADRFVADLLGLLGVRAFDPEGAEKTGIFGNG